MCCYSDEPWSIPTTDYDTGKSWIFFLENSRTWKVLENILENYAFFIGFNAKKAEIVNVPVCVDFYLFLKTTTVNILLHATVSAMDYTPNVVSKRCFIFIFKHSWAPKRSWIIYHGVLESPGKVLDFFPVKGWEPWIRYDGRCGLKSWLWSA